MIEVHGGDTPNVFKILVMLEETGFEYRRMPIDIFKGEQFSPEFLRISQNNKVPAIIDHAPSDGGDSLSVFESGAILFYVADKARSLIPTSVRQRSAIIEWVMWQMAGQGPMLGQAGHFMHYAPDQFPMPSGVTLTRRSVSIAFWTRACAAGVFSPGIIPLPISHAGPGFFSARTTMFHWKIIPTCIDGTAPSKAGRRSNGHWEILWCRNRQPLRRKCERYCSKKGEITDELHKAMNLPGLRIAFSQGLPSPWGVAARAFFDING